jgi:hypothetical protein
MADIETAPPPSLQINTRQVVAGSILIGLGGVIALAGVAMAGTALAAAFRDRVRQMEVPPSVLAKQNWDRVRAATTAATAAGYAELRNGRQPAAATAQ